MKRSGIATPDRVRKCNLRHSQHRLEGALSSFRAGDILVTLTYRERQPCYSRGQMAYHMQHWIRALRSKLERNGQPLRYVYTTEWRESGPVHHVLIGRDGGVTVDLLGRMWPYGGVQTVPVDLPAQVPGIASLFMGQAMEAGKGHTPFKRNWTASRGLERPGRSQEHVLKSRRIGVSESCEILQKGEGNSAHA